jgi:hypothetical protein
MGGGDSKSDLSKRDLTVPNFLETLKVVLFLSRREFGLRTLRVRSLVLDRIGKLAKRNKKCENKHRFMRYNNRLYFIVRHQII